MQAVLKLQILDRDNTNTPGEKRRMNDLPQSTALARKSTEKTHNRKLRQGILKIVKTSLRWSNNAQLPTQLKWHD